MFIGSTDKTHIHVYAEYSIQSICNNNVSCYTQLQVNTLVFPVQRKTQRKIIIRDFPEKDNRWKPCPN